MAKPAVIKYTEVGMSPASDKQIVTIAKFARVLKIKSPVEARKMSRIEASKVIRDMMAEIKGLKKGKK